MSRAVVLKQTRSAISRAVFFYASLWMGALLGCPTSAVAADPQLSGKAIYAKHCVECHGTNGEGAADAETEPLRGVRSLAELIKVIDETMPEEKSELCKGSDAEKVAQYLLKTFYNVKDDTSSAARIKLSRMTGQQYLNTVADLVGSFIGTPRWSTDRRGLDAQYFKDRRFRRDERAESRVDATVDFEFGKEKPHPEVKEAADFAIRWEGSLMADDTGDYELIVVSENGIKLWLNDSRAPLIDAWVSSKGKPRDNVATIRLIGGRPYPIRIDLFKFKEETASVSLQWKPPHKARQVIPTRSLSPQRVPVSFVVSTPFPADDQVSGYIRGTSISEAWNQAATSAAVEVATAVVAKFDRIAGGNKNGDRAERAKMFCHRFAERAFRRPLDEQQTRFFVDAHFDQAVEVEASVKRSVLLVLLSPRFLYPSIGGTSSDELTTASRLSYGLWDSLPDEALLNAAKSGNLKTAQQIDRQATRMLADPRARAKLRRFFHHWLLLDEKEALSKDAKLYPKFDGQLAADLRTSLDLFVEEVVWSDRSDYRELLLSNEVFVNRRLAEFLAVEAPPESGFHKTSFPSGKRAGVMTHPYLLSMLAYGDSSSPIHRGVFVTRRLLGRTLKPPPQATQFKDAAFTPDMTTREKVTLLTKPTACQSCHTVINPLGFSLEHFDAVGRYRQMERGKPIDAASPFTTVSGEQVKFSSARSLAEFIASSDHARSAFVDQLFHQAVKQPINGYGPDVRKKLTASFVASEFNIQKLLVEIMKVSALHRPKNDDPIQKTTPPESK